MSRAIVTLLLILVVVVGGIVALSRINTEKPLVRVEKVVPNAALAK